MNYCRVAEKDETIQGLQKDIEVQKKEASKLLEQAETQKKKNNVRPWDSYYAEACSMVPPFKQSQYILMKGETIWKCQICDFGDSCQHAYCLPF